MLEAEDILEVKTLKIVRTVPIKDHSRIPQARLDGSKSSGT